MTLFAAASVSKPLTALAALRLVQGGKLSLDEDVNARLRSWKVPESDLTRRQKVTLRGLLSHTAGIANQVFKGYAPTDPLPSVAQILRGESPASSTPVVVETVPGTAQQYSNAGYLIVQQLLTDVTGMPFPEILKGSVLGPTGMRRSTFEQPLPGKWRDAAATGYRADGSPVESRIVPFMAPAGLWTTPSDMARLIIELQAEYAGESARILSPQTAREMLPREGGSLPLGFHTISAGRSPIFGHKGHIDGFGCEVEALTDRQEGVVVMTNGDRGNGLAEEVIRAVAAEYEWPALRSQEHSVVEVNPAALSRYVGRYELPGRDTLSITLSGGRLLLQSRALGGEPRELLAESDTRFFLLDPAVVFEFRQSPDGAVTGLGVEVNGQVHEARVVR
jgi:CubicO group peptidase (beta-lactamase class C family)